MARSRAFNEEQVLDRAMEVFWRRGYNATSVDDLTRATGLGRGSLYGAFGDKEALFITCLNRYACQGEGALRQALEHPDPRQAITGFFAVLVARFSDPRRPPGCLQTNTVLETPAVGETIARQIASVVDGMEPVFYKVLCRAQARGQLRPGQDPLALAQFFATLVLGLGVMGKHSGDPTTIKNAAAVALSVFAD